MSNNINNISKVTDINKKFIDNYVSTCTNPENLIWILNTKTACIQNTERNVLLANPFLSADEVVKRARRQYFASFRSEFAKKFFPELITKKNKNGIDSLDLKIAARLAELRSNVA